MLSLVTSTVKCHCVELQRVSTCFGLTKATNSQKEATVHTPAAVSSPSIAVIDEGEGGSSVVSEDSNEHTAESTHDEICQDNVALRANNAVQEKEFDIKVEEPLCEMMEKTQLVLIDIPGVNEADSMSKYKDYVKKKWNTFDCVVVVMDAVQGVNTEDQLDLLRFVKKNNDEKKDIPTIVLGNKVDDPDDPEKQLLVRESHDKVVEIFGDGCSEKGMESLLTAARNGINRDGNQGQDVPHATFIPISAMHAYLYRKASNLTLERFKKLDKATINKIGHEEVGRKWRGMSDEKKFSTIQAAVSNPSKYQERLSATNFDSFLSVLSYFVGGEAAQTMLLKKQVKVMKQLLRFSIHQKYSKVNFSDALQQKSSDELENIGLLQLKMPSSLSDPSHWGHLVWMYCTFCERVDTV